MNKLSVPILLYFFMPLVSIAQIKGKVIGVADGDTFTLLTDNQQHIKIGLFGIDSPEEGQDYSQQAKDYLGDMIFFDTVQVLSKGLDESGRTLGIVTVHKINVNERMLQQGLAWHNTKFDKDTLWTAYENKARQLKKGLWSKPNAIPPWQWRSEHKQ